MAKERRAPSARRDARASAERAQREAEDRYREATDCWRRRGTGLTRPPRPRKRPRKRARAEAEQIAQDAHRDAASAEAAVKRAEEMRSSTARTAAEVAHSKSDRATPGRLGDLTKAELLDLAAAEGIQGRSSMTKR